MEVRNARRLKKGAALAVAAVLPAAVTMVALTLPSSAAPSGSYAVAPYVDLTNNQAPMLDKAAAAGLHAFTAAFVIGAGCSPIWGDSLPITNDPQVAGEISRAQTEGAQAIISFGGAAGADLAQSCTTESQVVAGYQSVINTFKVNHLDFDVEGGAIGDPTSINRRFQALKTIETNNPGIVISVTIPVLPTGPDNLGDAFLQAAKTNGTRLDVVNIMTMDYGGGFDGSGTNMGTQATQAAQATLSFIKTIWPSDTYANVGITPMIGQNDDSAEVFSEANAKSVETFAAANGLGRLAFWSVDRDQPCAGSASGLASCSEISQQSLDFTKIFNAYGGSPTPSPSPTPTKTPTPTPTPTTSPTPTPTKTPSPTPTPTGGGTSLANRGFESGLAPWTCEPGSGVVKTPVHAGSFALAAVPTSAQTGECDQVVRLAPNTTYKLTGWVDGPDAYLGVTGGATADTWTSSTSYVKLSVSFTTGSSGTVTVYIHGWYGGGAVHADTIALS